MRQDFGVTFVVSHSSCTGTPYTSQQDLHIAKLHQDCHIKGMERANVHLKFSLKVVNLKKLINKQRQHRVIFDLNRRSSN
ncbi:unnamed protein product, partial [Dovyalis caffra]